MVRKSRPDLAGFYFLWPCPAFALLTPSGYIDLGLAMTAMAAIEGAGIASRRSRLSKVPVSRTLSA